MIEVEKRSPVGASSVLGFMRRHTLVPLVIVLLLLAAVVDIVKPGTLSGGWITSALVSAAPLGLLAAGQTLVVLTAGIDLSVTSVATTSAYLVTSLANHGDPFALIIALSIGIVVGALNGVAVALFKAQPLIVTLGMGLVVNGALEIYHAVAISNLPEVPSYVIAIGSGVFLGYVPYSLLIWLSIAFLIFLLLKRTGLGRLIFAVGDNEAAAQLLAIRTWLVKLLAYTLSGFLSAVAGVILVGVTSAPQLGLADVFLLPSIAAVVIGGTSIFGGRGGYGGTVIGTLILVVLDNLQVLLNAAEPVREILYGCLILAVTTAYARFINR